MSLQIVVVSDSARRANQIERLMSGWRVKTVWANSIDECREHLSSNKERLLIFDDVHSPIPRSDALEAANRASAPMITILDHFDSKRWVEILKEGASDVLAEPLTAEQLRRSISTTAPKDQLVLQAGRWDWLSRLWHRSRNLFRV